MENHIIVNHKESLSYHKNKIITNVIDLQKDKKLISFFWWGWLVGGIRKKSLNMFVTVAAAVTASARIHMAKFKIMKEIVLFYTDTDSIDINKSLIKKFIGKELGVMKLEHIFNKAVFLAPKVYGGIRVEILMNIVKGGWGNI